MTENGDNERILTLDVTDDAEVQAVLRSIIDGADNIEVPDELMKDSGAPANDANLYAVVNKLTIPQKIKLALFGNHSARMLLIRDTNRQIPMFVLKNPRISDGEIAEIAKNTNVDDNVLRDLANNPQWMRNYNVKCAIVFNPKVPIDVSLKWVKHLNDGDLRRLAKSKNVPQVIATQSRKLLEKKKAQ